MQDVPGYDFAQLEPGNVVAGPAIVWTPITTLVVPQGHTATVDAYRSIIVEAASIDGGGLQS